MWLMLDEQFKVISFAMVISSNVFITFPCKATYRTKSALLGFARYRILRLVFTLLSKLCTYYGFVICMEYFIIGLYTWLNPNSESKQSASFKFKTCCLLSTHYFTSTNTITACFYLTYLAYERNYAGAYGQNVILCHQ